MTRPRAVTRRSLGSVSRIGPLAALWLLPAAILCTASYLVYDCHRIRAPARLGPEARAAVVAIVRQAFDARQALDDRARGAADEAGAARALGRRLAHGGPMIATLWHRGNAVARVEGRGDTIADAARACADALARDPRLRWIGPRIADEARIQIDIAVGRGPIHHDSELLRAIGLDPGLEGLGVALPDGREVALAPDELVARGLLGAATPIAFVPDFTLGLDFAGADAALASRAQIPLSEYRTLARRYFRFRTDSFIEPAPDATGASPAAPVPLVRGVAPGPAPTRRALREGALAGGRYLVAHLHESGRYVYQRDLATGAGSDPERDGPYSVPRHAGTTYFLAELYRLTRAPFLRAPIERALAHLAALVAEGGCAGTTAEGARFACVLDRGQSVAQLGSTALAVVALVEYRRATREVRHDALARALAEFLLFMQRPDGSFAHQYFPDRGAGGARDEHTQLLYYAGEAALALARMHAELGDERYRDAARRALDHLVGWYDRFIGGFFFGEEHWTCIAAEAAWPTIDDPAYLEFCLGYAAFLRRQQIAPGDFAGRDDLAGAYAVTPLMPPLNTPAGSRTEAMISTLLLARHHGRDAPAVRAQIRAALAYLLARQIGPGGGWSVPARVPDGGAGAVPGSPVDRGVRIDYVQHVCSAMIRGAALAE